MNVLFSTLLMLFTILLIAFPFIRRRQPIVGLGGEQSLEPINHKDMILGTLGEIEFDYHMNKLSTDDYQALKNNYAQIAVSVFKAEEANIFAKDDLTLSKYNRQDIEEEIERELQATSTCFRCGTPLLKTDQEFCHECGERQN